MLVLTRNVNQSVLIGSLIKVTVVRIGKHEIRLGFDAPQSLEILRAELIEDLANAENPPLVESDIC